VFQYNDSQCFKEFKTNQSDDEFNWLHIKDKYTAIDINNYPGFTQIQKYELFLAHFSTAEHINN
jgi:hypothetical protein